MAILRETIRWQRPRRPSRIAGLSAEEQAHVRRALRVLRLRYGTTLALAEAMGVSVSALGHATRPIRPPSALLAVRVARAAGVPLGRLLVGGFPRPGECPMCGHVTRKPARARMIDHA